MALLGIDPETYDGFIGTWTSLIHPDDSPRVAEETRRAMLTPGPSSRTASPSEPRRMQPDYPAHPAGILD